MLTTGIVFLCGVGYPNFRDIYCFEDRIEHTNFIHIGHQHIFDVTLFLFLSLSITITIQLLFITLLHYKNNIYRKNNREFRREIDSLVHWQKLMNRQKLFLSHSLICVCGLHYVRISLNNNVDIRVVSINIKEEASFFSVCRNTNAYFKMPII